MSKENSNQQKANIKNQQKKAIKIQESSTPSPLQSLDNQIGALENSPLDASYKQQAALQMGTQVGNQQLQRIIQRFQIQRREDETSFDVDSAVAYNQSRFNYDSDLVEQLHEIAQDDALYQAVIASQEMGADFARLVYAAQQHLFTDAGSQDGKLGPTTFRTIRQTTGNASTAAGLAEDGQFAEEQVYSSDYYNITNDRVGTFTVTGGFMEPNGHGRKSPKQAIFSEDPDAIVDLPASNRNLGVDYVVQDEGKPANVWYGGVVTFSGLAGGYGYRVILETDVTYVYNEQEYTVHQGYAHLARIDVEEGDIVNAGESVGKMGGTGSGGAVVYGEHIDLRTWITVDGARIDVSPNVLDAQLTERAGETETPTTEEPTNEETPTETPANDVETPITEEPANNNPLEAVANGQGLIQKGATGARAQQVQEALVAHGYILEVDNDFGQGTHDAVSAFQKHHVSLTEDGIVGQSTALALLSAPSSPLAKVANGEGTLIKQGETGIRVRLVQEGLIANGYAVEVDGDFGQNTFNAVQQLQRERGLSDDGVVGQDTALALISNQTAEPPTNETDPQPDDETITETPTEETPLSFETSIFAGNTLLQTVYDGKAVVSESSHNNGEHVVLIQQALLAAGLDLGEFGADGDFGAVSTLAMRAFQLGNELGDDGVVGQGTMTALIQFPYGSKSLANIQEELRNSEDTRWLSSVDDLARVLISEASIGNDAERRAVGWTYRNRLEEGIRVGAGQYARNQDPTQAYFTLAREILTAPMTDDITGGATHFFSPVAMPPNIQPDTSGFDVAAGLQDVIKPNGSMGQSYFPSWTETLEFKAVSGARDWYYMFYG